MQKVITINLNGHAYQVEETGYDALVTYLDTAQRQLKDNPDRAEIIADLEQAIAEKCSRFLDTHKSVVAAGEVDRIIAEMGPVDGSGGTGDASGGAAGAQGGERTGASAPKRLYLIREGAMLAGVCNGMAAYLNIDPTIVRVIFVGLALASKGLFAFVYFVLAVVIPAANTSEERAAAHGEPFNAQELIDRAKKQYAQFKDDRDWRRGWRRAHRRWRRQFRRTVRGTVGESMGVAAAVAPAAGYATRMLAGVMVPVLSLANAALFWLGAYAVLSLLTMREVFGVWLPDDVPVWAGILVVVFLYHSVAWPLRAARHASYQALGGPHHASIAALDALLSLGFAVLVVWFAYYNVPEVREFLRAMPDVWNSIQQR